MFTQMDIFVIFFYISIPLCFLVRYVRRIALHLEKKEGAKNER